MKHPLDVSSPFAPPLWRRRFGSSSTAELYPPDYRAAFASSNISMPPLHRPALRSACPRFAPGRSNGVSTFLWARTMCQDLFVMIFHGVGLGLCTIGQEVEGLEAAAPTCVGARSAEQPVTVGQAAGRSGRDPHHVALSSLAAASPPTLFLLP